MSEFAQNFRVFAAEANGLYRVYVVRRNDALGCDPLCLELKAAIERALPRLAGMRCLACDHRFMPAGPPPAAFVVVCPGGLTEKRSRSVMTSAVCEPCALKPDRDLGKLVHWPGIEQITISRTSGSA